MKEACLLGQWKRGRGLHAAAARRSMPLLSAGLHLNAASTPPPAPLLPAVDPVDVGTSASSNLQDILRLLTLWFSYGASPEVEAALAEGFGHVSIDTWLVVIPQVGVERPRDALLSQGCPVHAAPRMHAGRRRPVPKAALAGTGHARAANALLNPINLPSAQVIARIHTSSVPVRRLIHSLLVRIGRHHPQVGRQGGRVA